jgi:hypothetical protein
MKTPIRGAVVAALMATGPLVTLAQTTPSVPAPGASAPTAKPAPYRSAFEGYRRFEDQRIQSWREANDNVGRIGGWQTYAREAAGEGASPTPAGEHSQNKPAPGQAKLQAPTASTPGASPEPVKAPAPAPAKTASMPHDDHKGHGGHSTHKKP